MKHHTLGFCQMHSLRYEKYGDPMKVTKLRTKTPNELHSKLLAGRKILGDGCWEWQKSLSGRGYGQITYRGRTIGTHRAAAHVFLGLDLESGLITCHKCDNPPCFNPDHLFIGTSKENAQDREAKGRGGAWKRSRNDKGMFS